MGRLIREAIALLVEGASLSEEQATAAMDEIMRGEATPAQIGAFLVALRLKGETEEEIAGLARAVRTRAARIALPAQAVDTAGTGGDGLSLFNVSTAAALVAAGAGAMVAKHGNRAMSSHSGSADVLEALGVKVDLSPGQAADCLQALNIAFLFAPRFHPAFKHAVEPRREIGVRTVFNLLGPLTNPANLGGQVVGVADASLAPKMAGALGRLGIEHAWVVHGDDGMDEISACAPTTVHEVRGSGRRVFRLDPRDYGLCGGSLEEARASLPQESAAVIRAVLAGEGGVARELTLVNAAAAILVAGAAADLHQGMEKATRAIDSGDARQKLEDLVAFTSDIAQGLPA